MITKKEEEEEEVGEFELWRVVWFGGGENSRRFEFCLSN